MTRTKMVSDKMLFSLLLLSTACAAVTSDDSLQFSGPSRLRVEADGGYRGLVVKIDKDVPEDECPAILKNLKVRHMDKAR